MKNKEIEVWTNQKTTEAKRTVLMSMLFKNDPAGKFTASHSIDQLYITWMQESDNDSLYSEDTNGH